MSELKRKGSVKSDLESKVIANDEDIGSIQTVRSSKVGYFQEDGSKLVQAINSSIKYDKRLFVPAIDSISARVKSSTKRKIIPEESGKKILSALNQVRKEYIDGSSKIDHAVPSIYSYIYNKLSSIVGSDADYINVASGAEEQFAGDTRLLVRDMCDQLLGLLQRMHGVLIEKSSAYARTMVPGHFTKVEVPSSVGHFLMSFADKFYRDYSRFSASRKRLNLSPFGAGSMAGTAHPINQDLIAKSLGFDGVMSNSLDAVTDTDYTTEFLFNCAACGNHLSILAETLLLWHGPYMRFIDFPSEFVKGHPTLVKRKELEVLEVIRGKCAKINGLVSGALNIMHGLPNAYSNDIKEVLSMVETAYDDMRLMLDLMALMVSNMIVNRKTMKESAEQNYAIGPDVAGWFISTLKMPCKEAEEKTRAIIKLALEKGKKLSLLGLEELHVVDPRIDESIGSVRIASRSVVTRRSTGGTAHVQIRKSIRAANKRYA